MYKEEQEDTTLYKVVVNHEEQYSIWPAERENPLGWEEAGKRGTKTECLDAIKDIWTDMRPLSLRQHMDAQARKQQRAERQATSQSAMAGTRPDSPVMDELVQRLSEGDHPVVIRGMQDPIEGLRQCIERGYVHITFTETQGETELGMRLDKQASDLSEADFSQAKGKMHLVGTLVLNEVNVRCLADIDLQTLKGTGHLELLEGE